MLSRGHAYLILNYKGTNVGKYKWIISLVSVIFTTQQYDRRGEARLQTARERLNLFGR